MYKRQTLKCVLYVAVEQGWIDRHPFLAFKCAPDYKPRMFLSDEEIQRLMDIESVSYTHLLKDSFGNIYEKSPREMHERIASEIERLSLIHISGRAVRTKGPRGNHNSRGLPLVQLKKDRMHPCLLYTSNRILIY